MNRHRFATACCVLAAIAAPRAASAAYVTTRVADDAALRAFMPDERVAFVAEARTANNALRGAAELELSPGPRGSARSTATAQRDWTSGVAVPFELSYRVTDDPLSADAVVFRMGGAVLTFTPDLAFTDLFIRANASRRGSSSTVDNLFLNGAPIADGPRAAAGADAVDILRIGSADLSAGFRLTGDWTPEWSGRRAPGRSNLSLRISAGVPEPGTALLLAGGLLALLVQRRRRVVSV